MEKYFEINENNNIRCKLFCDKAVPMEKMVLYGHGFAGHKETGAAKKFAERVLSKYKGIAVMTFDLPCHGADVKKTLVLQDCMEYLRIVVSYIRESFRTDRIFSYATSFGGYLVLKYIAEYEDPFVKIALRSPAVNMYDVLTQAIMKDGDLDLLAKGKDVMVGFDRKIKVNPQFLQELLDNDIRKLDYLEHAEDILIMHGTKDEVVPFEAARDFAEENIIEFIPVENADHRFMNPQHMEAATKAVIEFFGF